MMAMATLVVVVLLAVGRNNCSNNALHVPCWGQLLRRSLRICDLLVPATVY
jgi:hypothetical protein